MSDRQSHRLVQVTFVKSCVKRTTFQQYMKLAFRSVCFIEAAHTAVAFVWGWLGRGGGYAFQNFGGSLGWSPLFIHFIFSRKLFGNFC